MLTNILGYNVYTDVGVVHAPKLDMNNKYELIDLYDIGYVLFCDKQLDTQLLWDQNSVKEDIFTDLPLIAVSDIDERVRLYSVGDIGNTNHNVEK